MIQLTAGQRQLLGAVERFVADPQKTVMLVLRHYHELIDVRIDPLQHSVALFQRPHSRRPGISTTLAAYAASAHRFEHLLFMLPNRAALAKANENFLLQQSPHHTLLANLMDSVHYGCPTTGQHLAMRVAGRPSPDFLAGGGASADGAVDGPRDNLVIYDNINAAQFREHAKRAPCCKTIYVVRVNSSALVGEYGPRREVAVVELNPHLHEEKEGAARAAAEKLLIYLHTLLMVGDHTVPRYSCEGDPAQYEPVFDYLRSVLVTT